MEDFDLETALRDFPLPDGQPDAVVNRAQIAMAMGVSDNTISKWVGLGLPVLEEGGNGREYRFQLSHCWAWRKWRDRDLEAQRSEADLAARQMQLLFLNDDGADSSLTDGLTAKARAELAQTALLQMKVDEQRGDLVRTGRVRELFERMIVAFVTNTRTVVDYCEMEFQLNPAQVDALERRCHQVIEQARIDLADTVRHGQSSVTPIGSLIPVQGAGQT